MLVLNSRHAAIAKAASKDVRRFTLDTVHVKDNGDGRYSLTATDGRIAARIEGQAVPTDALAQLGASLPNGGTVGMVKAKNFAAALKATGRKPAEVVLSMTPPTDQTTDGQAGRYTIATETSTTVGDLASGRFPDLDSAIPSDPGAVTVTLNPALLARLLAVASDLGIEQVTLEVRTSADHYGRPTGKPVVLRGANDSGETFTSIIMPISK